MSENKTSSGGLGFCGLLAIVFITLRLCHVISWSWWWVLSPIWGGLALVLLFAVVYIVFVGAAGSIKRKRYEQNKS